jgi:hypothetical protein
MEILWLTNFHPAGAPMEDRAEQEALMKIIRVLTGALTCALIVGVALALSSNAIENRGAADIVIEGGNRGDVPFPHLQHQDKLVDCNVCHAVFPQQRGAIETLKAEGQLKPRQVMNKQCTNCHREKKRAGEKSGPTTCKSCHTGSKG